MNKGWIKLHRKLLDNPTLKWDTNAFIVFTKLLLVMDYKTGSYNLGRFQLAELTGLKPGTAYKTLKRLEKAEMVTLRSNNKYTTISICKWNEYQSDDNNGGNNQVTTKSQPDNTKQEYKKTRSKNIKTITNVIGEPVYGNADINLIVDVFEKAIGKQPRAAKQRQAAQTLKQRHGVDRVLKAIEFYTQVRGTPYSPNIATLEDLRDKWINLETFAGKKLTNQPKGVIQI